MAPIRVVWWSLRELTIHNSNSTNKVARIWRFSVNENTKEMEIANRLATVVGDEQGKLEVLEWIAMKKLGSSTWLLLKLG